MRTDLSNDEMIIEIIRTFKRHGWEVFDYRYYCLLRKSEAGFTKKVFINKNNMKYLAYDNGMPFRYAGRGRIEVCGKIEFLDNDGDIEISKCMHSFCTYLGDWIDEYHAENYIDSYM